MIRQYGAQRFRMENGRPVGTVPVGTIADISNSPMTAYRRWANYKPRPRRVIVLAWKPRIVSAWRRGSDGRYIDSYVARGGHIAVCRDLQSGRMIEVSDVHLNQEGN